MIDVPHPQLWWIPGAPLVVGLLLWPFAGRATRGLVGLAGALALVASLFAAYGALARMLDMSGWRDASLGLYAGARLVGADPLDRAGLALDPWMVAPLFAVGIAGLAAHLLGLTTRGGGVRRAQAPVTASQLCAQLVVTGSVLVACLARELDVVAGAVSVASLASYGVLVGGDTDRRGVDAANRLFATHRIGDVALVVALAVLGVAFGTLDVEQAARVAVAVDPWLRPTASPLAGIPARWAWSFIAGLLAVAAATRLSFVPLPSPADVSRVPTSALALVHGVGLLGAGAVLLLRVVPLLNIAPEVAFALGVVAAASATAHAVRALVADRLVPLDVLLASSVAALAAAGLAVGELAGASLGAAFAILVVVPLSSSSAAVVEATDGEDRIFSLGGLWRPLRGSDAVRALATFALAGFPGFTSFFVVEHVLWAAQASPRRSVWIAWLVGAAALALSVAAFRALHLVFSGDAPRATLARPPRDTSAWRVLTGAAVALLAAGAGVATIGSAAIAELFLDGYREPYWTFIAPATTAARSTLTTVAADPHAAVDAGRHLVTLGVVAATGLLGYGISAALFRTGPTRLHARLIRVPPIAKLRALVGSADDVEERATETVVQSAVQLSRAVGVGLLPWLLETLLQRIPGLLVTTSGALLRVVHNGDVQRALALVLLAAIALLAGGRLL